MRLHMVLNRDGGTFRTLNMDAYCDRAREVLAGGGHDVSFDVAAAGDIDSALEMAAARKDIDAIVAGGGDGTISCAARIAWKAGMPLGVIPAGTMNLFARSLGLPLDLDAVLAVLAEAEIAPVDISSVNGQGFIHQFAIGLHPRMVRFRNRYDFATRLGKIRASTQAAIDVIFDPPSFVVDAEIDGAPERTRVSMISVSNNPFGPDPLMFQDRLDTGQLGYYTAPPLPPAGVARLALDILSGRRDRNPHFTERRASTARLRFPRHRKSANMVLDGELLPLPREVDIRIHPGELKVLRPAKA
ncbi:MAG: diacylglycerol kinase family lipid kinase [Rhizobiaceae bacterium]|nr:diacylglycerol kinase family lipid kinase [Rhizobiaceae bacterium]